MPQVYYDNSWSYDFIPYCTYDIRLATACNPGVAPKSDRGSLALSKLGEDSMGGSNADTTAANLAYKENGAKVTVDSTYPGYGTDALNDGWFATPENHNQSNWAKESWASMDIGTDHWIEFTFAETKNVSSVKVHWANDNGTYYSPQKAVVQVWIDGAWQDVATFTNEPDSADEDFKAFLETTEFSFDTVSTQRVRVLQPKGMGCADKYGDPVRKNIMWVSEVEIFS